MQFFRKKAKKGKIFENLGENVQNLKIFLKRAGDCMRLLYVIYKQLEKALECKTISNKNIVILCYQTDTKELKFSRFVR